MPSLRLCLSLTLLLAATGCGRHAASATNREPEPTTASASRGASLFARSCAVCHGAAGSGGRLGPSLRGERKRRTESEVHALIADPAPPMPKLFPGQMSEQDVNDLTAYVETL